MDLQNIIDRLKEDHDCLSIAILALEKIASGNPKRRGRPRKTLDLSSKGIRELEETYKLGFEPAKRHNPGRRQRKPFALSRLITGGIR